MNENWIKILEITERHEILEYLKKEFDENNIKYKIKFEDKWEGRSLPKYIGKFAVYVQEKFKDEAEKIIDRYYENNEEIIEVIDEKEEGKTEDNETEEESKKIAERQKITIKIYTGIVICMIISAIIVGTIIRK